jgi:hypothetical protein
MDEQSGKIHFTRSQVDYLIKKTGENEAGEAIEVFVKIIQSEGIDPMKMIDYLDRLMEKDGIR